MADLIDLGGQGPKVVGVHLTSPWWTGSYEVTQGWGPTTYDSEPAGHGYPHWHAGVDIGLPCGTTLTLPQIDLMGTITAKYVNNPGGYGTALVIQIRSSIDPKGSLDIWLGHLASRLVKDGQVLKAGDQLAKTNNTGNSSGCHLHFETRPAGGGYGTDYNPSSWLQSAVSAVTQTENQQNADNPINQAITAAFAELGTAVQGAEQEAVHTLTAMAEVGGGVTLMLGGFLVMALGMMGQRPGQMVQTVQRPIRSAQARSQRDAAARAAALAAEEKGRLAEEAAAATRERASRRAEAQRLVRIRVDTPDGPQFRYFRQGSTAAANARLVGRRAARERSAMRRDPAAALRRRYGTPGTTTSYRRATVGG